MRTDPRVETDRGSFPVSWRQLGVATAAVAIFFLLRNEFVNHDGQTFGGYFQSALRHGTLFVTYDEMLEYYVHFRYWTMAREWWGWGVIFTCQVMSCVAGGLFVLVILEYCRQTSPSRSWALAGLCLSGAYVQLFFGDCENYAFTAMLITTYLLASLQYLRGRAPIWQPGAVLGLAMSFHLVSGFLLPSLLYLWWIAIRRGERRGVAASIACLTGAVAATVGLIASSGVPLSNFFYYTHAMGRGGDFMRNLATPSGGYYRDIFNVLMLLAPGSVFLIPLVLHRRIRLEPENVHLLLACSCTVPFIFLWRAQLGPYEDWNLFASATLPLSFLVWRNVIVLDPGRRIRPIPVAAGLAAMHSLAWILVNHFAYGS